MGTNYYAIKKQPFFEKKKAIRAIKDDNFEGLCQYFNNIERVHIGKQSHGWQFLFNPNDCKYYELTRESIDNFLRSEDVVFENEYGDRISVDDFWNMVESNADNMNNARYDEERQYENHSFFSIRQYEFYEDNLRFSTTTSFG